MTRGKSTRTDMDNWSLTEVWNIDNKMVVANSVEEAISLWKDYIGLDNYKEPRCIQRMYIDSQILGCEAIIRTETPADRLTKTDIIEVVRALKNYRSIDVAWYTHSNNHIAERLMDEFIGKPDIRVSASDENKQP